MRCQGCFRVHGVSVRVCAGAGSTQARKVTCWSPPALALHLCLDLYGFKVLSNSNRVPVFLLVFCTCLDQAGARFGLGLARSFLCLLRLSLAWRPSSLEPSGPVQMDGFGFGFGSRPVFFRQPGWMPPIMNKWTGGCMVWAGFGSKLLVLIEIEPVSVREAVGGH